ncbi:TatD family hydrolase [Pyrodictium abyssi]|uniref:TatD family hydrolase n=1 Tax=Pyrodictium abyssi TaxID=54256 RepID=A0ABM8IZ50_9CREN|nr:TatD family hydrolase [Pyrodictium abyssi]
MKLVFGDAHAHSSPLGMGAAAVAKRFAEKGGWFMALVMLPPWHYGLDARPGFEMYMKAIDIHLRECRRAREAGLRVACLAGFHPAEVDKLISAGLSPEDVLSLGLRVVEYVGEMCRQGLLDGIGEVGRQHYKTMPERVAIASTIMTRALEYARDNDCIVHLHLENAGPATVDTTAKLVELVSVPKSRILFHHASARVASHAAASGYWATVAGKKELMRRVFEKIGVKHIMIESDYIDDPKRPCVSSCPWEIIDRQVELMRSGVVDEETLYRINVDNIVEFYRVEPP